MTVGIIGLGIMGAAFASNLLKAGIAVAGADPDTAAQSRLLVAGGVAHAAVGDWVAKCDLVLISVASPTVLSSVASALAVTLKPGQIVLETGTFALEDKIAAQQVIERSGAVLLDSTVSGTGKQAANADLVIMASGPDAAIDHARPYLAHLCHTVIDAGGFGMGSKLKYVANHAVALHNCAAAETLHYADALGLDRDVVFNLLSKGAGQSRMLDLRMPLMIAGAYQPATAQMSMFEKDLSIIGDDIKALGISTPLFDAASALYDKGWTLLPQDYDTAAIFEVYRNMDDPDERS